jgi:hypothetical protein
MPVVAATSPSGTLRPLGSAVREALDRPLSPRVVRRGLAARDGSLRRPGRCDRRTRDHRFVRVDLYDLGHRARAAGLRLPVRHAPHEPLIAPVYPLLSGALAAVAHVGQSATVPFPSRGAMGPNCTTAIAAMRPWAFRSGAGPFLATRWIACSGWLVLMAGIVAWLRAAGRGRRGWEPATLLVVASLPPVFLTVSFYLHPQDLVALGLALGAMACAVRGRWLSAGILVGLAVLSQQYALLVAAPLFVLAPTGSRGRLLAGAAGAAPSSSRRSWRRAHRASSVLSLSVRGTPPPSAGPSCGTSRTRVRPLSWFRASCPCSWPWRSPCGSGAGSAPPL